MTEHAEKNILQFNQISGSVQEMLKEIQENK